jgi:hypothetical protein
MEFCSQEMSMNIPLQSSLMEFLPSNGFRFMVYSFLQPGAEHEYPATQGFRQPLE